MNPTPSAPLVLTPEIEAGIAATQAAQAAEDKAGAKAATTALPGPLRDVFAPAPDIKVERWSIRRFVDRDFVFLSWLDHPLSSFTALSDGSYQFMPSGELCYQLCWLLSRPIPVSKQAFKELGVAGVKESAMDEFGDLPIHALGKLMEAIAKQMTVYAAAHLDYKMKQEGENGGPPSP